MVAAPSKLAGFSGVALAGEVIMRAIARPTNPKVVLNFMSALLC